MNTNVEMDSEAYSTVTALGLGAEQSGWQSQGSGHQD